MSSKLRTFVTIISSIPDRRIHSGLVVALIVSPYAFWISAIAGHKKHLTFCRLWYVFKLTAMGRSKGLKDEDPKTRSLREHHALHPHPETVRDEAFQQREFLDPRDRVQVRYEMLRRHRIEGKPVSEVARSFGMSRQAFYVTDAIFSEHGIPGLLPRQRGPKGAHKCTDEVLDFVEQWLPEGKETLVEAIRRRFSITINSRSIERALARRKKKRARKQREAQG